MTIDVLNPTTGDVVNRYEAMDAQTIDERIDAAGSAYAAWRQIKMDERGAYLRDAAALLEKNQKRYAGLMALEMGKPIRDARAEIEKCAWLCRQVAESAAQMLAPEIVKTDAQKSFVTFPPLGVVLGVMPWNYPFWQVFRFAAPTLMAGNAVLLKHASNVPGCSLAIEAVMHEAGFPPTLFQALLISSKQVQAVVDHPSVKAVALTGSNAAGQAVAARAGRRIKKTVLELGGSDPYLILADADLDLAADACAVGRLLNAGQSCIAAKRLIVVEAVREAFEQRLVEKMKSVRMGDPMDEETEIGPLARSDLRDTLHRQVRESIDAGARLLLGGEIPGGRGFFYPPTILTDVRSGMPAFDEETFGPVAAVISAADEQEAILLANQTDFGLGAVVFTRDVKRGEQIAAERLEAGNCFVNAFVKSDPRLPFGGIKQSGYGRELSHYGIKEFVNIKTVYVVQP
ncbi:NAD-dependent succinate-semialdehyde dehydrogenase [Desulfosarcina sp.]|uniref:NAD-dependent succinate-semialdehyde dehydrogenase n=1 Tax=Desulfosarcina sp. TaxID=2027861 RepID=UPI003970EFF5